jgi:hypothetical protein
MLIEDGGDKILPYPGSMGVWEDRPGIVVKAYRAEAEYVYMGGDYHAAYSPKAKPGSGGPARELTRQVVYVRPNYVVVYDRATTLKANYNKELRWHFLKAPLVKDNSFEAASGNSKLFGETFSTLPLITSESAEKVGGATVYQLRTHAQKPALTNRFVTVFEVAAGAVSSRTPARHIIDADGHMEGGQIGDQVVLFGCSGPVAASAVVRFKLAGKSHVLLTDLRPGQAYEVNVNGAPPKRATANPQGIIRFRTEADSDSSLEVVAAR